MDAHQKAVAEARAVAQSAWLARWALVEMPSGARFTHALPCGHARNWVRQADGKKVFLHGSVWWLLLDRSKLLHVGSASDALEGAAGALAAAEATELAEEPGVGEKGKICRGLTGANPPLLFPGEAVEPLRAALVAAGERQHSVDAKLGDVRHALERAQFAAFRALLDQDALEASQASRKKRHVGYGSTGVYNTFAGAAAESGRNHVAGEWRRRALSEFPLFSHDIRTARTILSAIDTSAPLAAALAKSRAVRPATIRAFAGWPFGEGTRPTNLGRMIRMADVAPPDWLPRTGEAWESLRVFARTMKDFGFLPSEPAPGQPSPEGAYAARLRLLAGAIRRNGPGWAGTWTGERHLDAARGHLADTGLAFCLEVLLPALYARGAEWLHASAGRRSPTLALQDLGAAWILATRSPRAAFRVSAGHLGRLMVGQPGLPVDGSTAADSQADGWLPLGDDAISPEGIAIINLSTQRALQEEGEAMNHCVGSYAWRCRHGLCRIVSLRRHAPDGQERLSTAEVFVDADRFPRVVQHKAHSNRPPKDTEREALAWYLRQLREGRVASSIAELAAEAARTPNVTYAVGFDANRPYHRNPVVAAGADLPALLDAAAGFEWRDPAARERVWRTWARLLGLDGRRITADAWVASCPNDLLEADPDCQYRRLVSASNAAQTSEAAA